MPRANRFYVPYVEQLKGHLGIKAIYRTAEAESDDNCTIKEVSLD